MNMSIDDSKISPQIKKLTGFTKTANQELTPAMQKSVVTIASNVKPFVPVFRGRLRGSIFGKVVSSFGSNVVGRVGSSVRGPYPKVQNFGSEKRWFPPVARIREWVRLKLRVPAGQLDSVAYLVARKISKSGLKGHQFMQKGLAKSRSFVNRQFAAATDRIVKRLKV